MANTRSATAVAIGAVSQEFQRQYGVSASAAKAWCLAALGAPEVQEAILKAAHAEALKLLIPRGPRLPGVE